MDLKMVKKFREKLEALVNQIQAREGRWVFRSSEAVTTTDSVGNGS
jgi:hypothetical protein